MMKITFKGETWFDEELVATKTQYLLQVWDKLRIQNKKK